MSIQSQLKCDTLSENPAHAAFYEN